MNAFVDKYNKGSYVTRIPAEGAVNTRHWPTRHVGGHQAESEIQEKYVSDTPGCCAKQQLRRMRLRTNALPGRPVTQSS